MHPPAGYPDFDDIYHVPAYRRALERGNAINSFAVL
jgi:hypothetical protein